MTIFRNDHGGKYDQLFIQRLTVFNTLAIVARRRLRDVESIYCRQASARAAWLWKKRLRIIPDHTYTKIRDEYFVGVQFEMVAALATRFFSEGDRYLSRYFELRMVEDLGPSTGLVLDYKLMSASLSGRTCILVPATPFLDVVRRNHATDALAIDAHWSVDGAMWACRTLAVACVKVARAAAHVLTELSRRRDNRVNRLPVISVFGHRGGESLDVRTDLFWLDPRREYPNVVVEVARIRYPRFSPAVIDELGQRKIRVIETHGGRRLYAKSIHWKPGARFIRGVIRSTAHVARQLVLGRSEPLGLRWWKAIHALRYWLLVHERLDYYHAFNVKAELRIGMGEAQEPAYSSALNEYGGFTCTAQYSMSMFYANYTSTSTIHLYFGRAYMNPRLPLRARFSIANGYTYKTSLTADEKVVADLQTRLRNAGVRRSACFFEERPTYEFSMRYLHAAYRFLLQRVLDDPGFGVIFKPKKPHVSAELLRTELGPIVDQAMNTGRVIVLEWDYYPGLVARAVDLTLGILCTATLEAALLGRPTLHLNFRNYIPPFFRPASENIVDNVPDLSEAVNQFFTHGGRSQIGRHSVEFIRGMDHFDDADASARIEYLVTRYVAEMARGETPEGALDHTLRGFRERWGWPEFGSSVEQEVSAPVGVGAEV